MLILTVLLSFLNYHDNSQFASELLSCLLLHQVDDCDDQGLTGLQAVAANGYEELARLLIMKGAALEKSNIFDWTPLLHAARHGHTGEHWVIVLHSSIFPPLSDTILSLQAL